MEFLASWGLFAVKFATVLVFFLIFIGFVAALKSCKDEESDDLKFKFTDLLARRESRKESIESAIEDFDFSMDEKEKKKSLKAKAKALKKETETKFDKRAKRIEEAQKNGLFCPEKLFVLNFDGDAQANAVNHLIQKVNLLLDVATPKDEIVINLTSPGGVVNGYGLCASVLERIRAKGVNLVVCVDNVAASGGYMMACVASKIVAAPFAYIGSIGVVAQIPNFNKVLKKHDVEYEQVTAGKYKRTLTMFGENTPEGREKFKQELTLIHDRIKAIVNKYRPDIDIDKIATGEFWLATDAKERNLVDEICTFDAYLQNRLDFTKVCAIKIGIENKKKKSLVDLIKKLLMAKTWTRAISKQVQDIVVKDNTYHL